MSSNSIQPRQYGSDVEKLNPMQRMFIEELLADETFNASKAAKKAGYKIPGVQSSKLLRQPRIRAILGKALRERIERCQLTADAVLQHLATALFLDPMDLFERTSSGGFLVKDLESIPVEVRRCITKIKQRVRIVDGEPETYVEIDLMSKDSALVNAMKHLMLINPETSQQTNVVVGSDIISTLLSQVESERSVIDAKFIEMKATPEEVQR